jgi:type VI secretion system ImpC/EvpB family protein
VGPHVVAAPDPGQASMLKAVDEAIGTAMRAILHHPDFQAVESTWRSLDLIARKVETGGGMEMVLYDIAAEELAADLAEHDELSESALFKILAERPLEDAREGRLAAMIGLYTFDEIPPHAELLGRMAKIAAHIDAPFFAAITPDYLDVKMDDRHELTAEAWDALRDEPEAKYLGLASPRFLLRHPYGAKTDPIDPFEFEEFTLTGGLSGMLWANPAVLVAILLAETAVQGGKNMSLGKVMSLGEMPYYWITDQYGDQVALPCTERLLSQRKAEDTVARGYMPVLSIKGRDVVRLGGFNSVGGGEILGPWASGEGAAVSSARRARMASSIGMGAGLAAGTGAAAGSARARPGEKLIDIAAGLPGEGDDEEEDDDDLGFGGDDDDDDLDSLLAGFDEDSDSGDSDSGDDDMDDELAALLRDLE